MKVASNISREVIRLKHLFPIQITGAWGEDPVDNQGTICLRAADILTHQISHLTTNLTRRSYSESEISSKALKEGDLIIEKSGGGEKQPVGRIVKFKLDEPSLCSNFLCILRPDQSKILPHFGAYLLYSLWDCREVEKHIKQTTGIQNLDSSSYLDVHISLPSIDSQKVVSDYLDREISQIDNLITAKEQMLTLLEEKRAALISHAVTRGLDPNVAFKQSGLDWLGDIPQHWSIERAKGLFREVDNRTTSGEEELLSLRMHVGLVPHHDVSDKILEPKDVIGFKKVETGQLVINRMRASMGLIAISPQNGLVSPDYAVFDIVKLIHIPYFLALFNTSLVGALFRSSSKGLGTGSSGFLRLYSESFLSIHFPVPSLDEQKEITNFLDQEQQRTGELEKALTDSISLLKERRSALITAAVTGQITLEEMKK